MTTNVTLVRLDGTVHAVQAPNGESVMAAIRDAGFDELLALCGGSCSCATCHCFFDDATMAKIGPATGDEADLLGGSSSCGPNSRLSCQVKVSPELAGMRVTIAPED
jgi:ferredoxin